MRLTGTAPSSTSSLLLGALLLAAPPVIAAAGSDDTKPESCRKGEAPAVVAPRERQSANRCPVAHAGNDHRAAVGETVRLDGRRSHDYDGERLRFHWSLVARPAGSDAVIEDALSFRARFEVDVSGAYVAELTVTDAAGARAVDRVRIDTGGAAPIAVAGEDRRAVVGETVVLDGARSADIDETPIAYEWSLVAPAGSNARLRSADTASPSFTVDVPGEYRARLVVHDGNRRSRPDEIIVGTVNLPPVADAGLSMLGRVGERHRFDGSGSADPEGAALSYTWALVQAPAGSEAVLHRARTPQPELELDVAGLYLLQLYVDDGERLSVADAVVIDARVDGPLPPAEAASEFLRRYPELGGGDRDGDGVVDPLDNCVNVANGDQRDTDGDGLGNVCDPDLNNDGVVNFSDLGLLRDAFFSIAGQPDFNPDADFNGDDVVNFGDLAVLKEAFFGPPGPPGTLTWINGAGGAWADTANWSPQTLPGSGTLAVIDLEPDVDVTIGGSVAAVAGPLMLGDTLVISGGSLSEAKVLPGAGNIVVAPAGAGLDGVTVNVPMLLQNGGVATIAGGLELNAIATVQGTSIPTGLLFDGGAQTLSGSGTVVYDSNFNGNLLETFVRPAGTGARLTIGPGITIRGNNGVVGDAGLPLLLQGTVDADTTSAVIRVVGTGSSLGGTLRAGAGGTLQVGGSFDTLAGGVLLDSVGGTMQLLNGSSLMTATVNGTPGTALRVIGVVNFSAVTYNTDLIIENGRFVNVTNGLTLNGTASIEGRTLQTGLGFDGTQTLAGSGVVVFDSNFNGNISEPQVVPLDGTLTIGPNVLIRGNNGTVGSAVLPTVIQGTVQSDVTNAFIRILGAGSRIVGTLRTLNDGLISLGGTFDNGGGRGADSFVLDSTDGTLFVGNGATLADTTIDGVPGSLILVPSTNAALAGCILNDIALVIQNGGIVTVTDDLVVNGTVSIQGTSFDTGLDFDGGSQSLSGNAEISFDSNFNGSVFEPHVRPINGGILTIGPEITITGNNGTIGAPAETTTVLGTVRADSGGEMQLRGNVSATGLLQAQNNMVLRLRDTFDNGGQSVSVEALTGTVALGGFGAFTLRDTVVDVTPGSTVTVTTDGAAFDGVTFNGVDLTVPNGSIVTVTDGLTLNGTAAIEGTSFNTGFNFDGGSQSLSGSAQIVFETNFNGLVSEPRVGPINGATLNIGAGVTISGNNGTVGGTDGTTVIDGTVQADSGGEMRIRGTVSGTGTLRAANGMVLRLMDTFDNGGQAISAEALSGTIVLGGFAPFVLRDTVLDATSGSAVTIGSSDASLDGATLTGVAVTVPNGVLVTVNGGLTLNGTATIAGTNNPTGLLFDGTQTFGGTADVTFAANFNSQVNEPQIRASSGTLTLGPGLAISGDRGTIGTSGLPLVNQAIVSVSGLNTRIEVEGSSVGHSGEFSAAGGGTLNVDNLGTTSGSLRTRGGFLTVNSDLVFAPGAALESEIAGTGVTDSGLLTVAGDADFSAGALNISRIGGFIATPGDSFTIVDYGTLSGGFGSVTGTDAGGGNSFIVTDTGSELVLDTL